MAPFLNSSKKKSKAATSWPAFVLASCLILGVAGPLLIKPAQAQMSTLVVESVPAIKQSIWETMLQALKKAGSIAFQRTLSTALNKIAYDTANYIGSGGAGQKPLFVTQNFGAYMAQIGDEAAGTFIESFVNNLNNPGSDDCNAQLASCRSNCAASNTSSGDLDSSLAASNQQVICSNACTDKLTACTAKNVNATAAAMKTTPSFNVCSPSSLQAKLKIGLGLIDQNRPAPPNCTASQMVKNWDADINQKLKDLRDPNYLTLFSDIFDPRSNDLGIYVQAKTDLSSKALIDTENAKTGYMTHGGWLDVRNIAGMTDAPPGSAKRELETAQAIQESNFGKITGDVFVDASSVFLNQLALSAFNTLLRSLSKNNNANTPTASGYQSDPRSGSGAAPLAEVTTKLLKPNFSVRTDYNVISSLAVCPDPKNPGPDNCVIDDQFMQAVTEKKTVAEAINEGYLHSDWQFRADGSGDSYSRFYALRNLMILRKFRIVPVGWETAAKLIGDPTNPHKATLGDLVSCFDPKDEYNTFSNDFGVDHTWCEGLVDPNWVLKAPLNSCTKEGFGGQIIERNVTEADAYASSTLNITRADDYCADTQSCIKEKKDGSCEAYGYCTEERRTWNFGSNSCQPVNNTCESFKNPYNGKSVSYLENTLDYSNCNPENAGCRQYSLTGAYNAALGQVAWVNSADKKVYLNGNLGTCTSADEGCTGLLRIKPTWGANLIMDSDLSQDNIGDSSHGGDLNDWPVYEAASIVDMDDGSGKAIKFDAQNVNGLYSDADNSLLPANFQVIPGQAYTLSADVYLAEGRDVTLVLGEETDGFSQSTAVKGSWQHLSVTRPAGSSYNEPTFKIIGHFQNIVTRKTTFFVRNVKFEVSGWDTGYKSYGNSKFYEKLLPSYLEQTCYSNVSGASKDYSLKAGAPSVCSNYARKCNQAEVGCESFTAVRDGLTTAAKVTDADYCPADCVGYDMYVSRENYFNVQASENLIPEKAQSCSAASAGCNEFTNLDAIGQGGEQKEYYTRLKQCIKPDEANCSTFYTWEGTAAGYQLRSYYLKKFGGSPFVASPEDGLCDEVIFNKAVGDPQANPDCQKFYTATGEVSYHLLSRTVTCSENCHAYRLSEKNPGNVCLNGGTWDAAAGACVYMAIPGEGQTCAAQDNGCREYNGNNGSNVKLLKVSGFESGLGGWASPGAQLSVISNDKDGHSLSVAGSVQQPAGDIASSGSSYSIKFIARAAADTDLNVYFSDPATGVKSSFTAVKIAGGNDWNIYQANLSRLDHAPSSLEVLGIDGSGAFLIDDIVLSEITDRYYLIKGSSQIPADCSYDNLNNYQGPEFNLGCQQYYDRDNLKHNLHQFTKLCSNSSVGCEQMINTNNSAAYRPEFWKDGVSVPSCEPGDPSCLKVGGDTAIYAVYDPSKLCGAANQGCSRLGEGQGGLNFTGWSDVFKKNNPDEYGKILCGSASVGCEKWGRSDGGDFSYFKDPGSAVCVYRAGASSGKTKRWYKIPVKRCDTDNNGTISPTEGVGRVCNTDGDCGANKCLLDNNDYDCPVSYIKTIGLGGEGNQVPVPAGNAGLCDAAESGCGEYIDPVTKFSPNLVINPDKKEICDKDGNCAVEGWGTAGQEIKLQPYKLYSVVRTGTDEGMKLNFSDNIRVLQADNSFGPETASLKIYDPLIFLSLNNKSAILGDGGVQIKELAVDYQLSSEINSSGCNSQTKYDNGCVLFNERSVSGASGLASLNYDALQTEDGKTPANCASTGTCTANKLLKVRPDRVCDKWLDCISFIQDPLTKKKTCYAFASCDRLDNKGECANFLPSDSLGTNLDTKTNPNYTGYSLASKYQLEDMSLVGQSLEGWFTFDHKDDTCLNATTSASIIRNPDDAKSETDYPAIGSGYLMVPDNGACNLELKDETSGNTSDAEKFYISYLVNTKNSGGASARITIYGGKVSSSSPIHLDAQSSAGWQRVVQEFSLGTGPKDQISLSLGSSNQAGSGKVYFDDIQVNPVLKVSGNAFASPECRLYPSSDSLSCDSKNKNIVSNGLKGYCLEHDPLNKDVCLLWYPMDNIPVPSLSSLGFSGNFPLNYCTQTNGNFELVEKRVGYHIPDGDPHWENGVYIRDGSFDSNEVIIWDGSNTKHTYKDTDDQCTILGSAHDFLGLLCPPDYDFLLSVKAGSGGASLGHFNYMCIPKPAGLKFSVATVDYTNSANGGNWEKCQDQRFSEGYAIYNGFEGFEGKQNPNLMIYDYTDNALKFVPGNVPAGGGSANIFHLTCNNIIQTVDSSGANKAWVERVKKNSPYTLNSSLGLFKADIKQGLESAPFGSAGFGNINTNDTAKTLKDIEGSGAPFAGLPYGCTGGNCKLIGTCSGDPSYMCLATTSPDTELNSFTCGTGVNRHGTCTPLFNDSRTSYIDVIKNIFLSAPKALNLSGGKYQAGSGFDSGIGMKICPTTGRPENSFCAVYPKISNLNLYYEDNKITLGSGPLDVRQKGLYRLEFNSTVDPEQQPLKKIEINWGDGFTQNITNVDNHPENGSPHVIYHYYAQTGLKNIGVTITDNWTKYCNSLKPDPGHSCYEH